MNTLNSQHKWNPTPQEAKTIQESLREKIRQTPLKTDIQTIAGADISFEKGADQAYAGIVVLQYPTLEIIEQKVTQAQLEFPYIPGLLAFREIPPLIKAWERLSHPPDALMMDGHGIAHPRKMGIAAHFGVLADLPTLGCAKKGLVGHYETPPEQSGEYTYLYDDHGQTIGAVYRTRTRVKPVFISVGHKMTLQQAIKIIENCRSGYKIPAPTRQAHLLVNKARRGDIITID